MGGANTIFCEFFYSFTHFQFWVTVTLKKALNQLYWLSLSLLGQWNVGQLGKTQHCKN